MDRSCSHDVYIKGLCGNCGARLDPPQSTSVSMIHSVPELKVSEKLAKKIGRADQERLIEERKLVLLVDLDQTILHTTHENVRNDPYVHSFTLWPGHPTYYTKLRPYLKEFLERMSKIYELHIFTFGCRKYAHKIASIIDPDQVYFGSRILSRDESADQIYKKGNLNNLFPCGDAMVCIIDDRSDVWKDAGNLIQVKTYSYFKTSISDGAQQRKQQDSAKYLEDSDESLDRDADQLEALLCDSDDDEDTAKEKPPSPPSPHDNDDDKPNETSEENQNEVSEQEKQIEDPEAKEKQVKNPDAQESNNVDEAKDETESQPRSPSPIRDPDDHLLQLPVILERIHDKWYMELDEQRQFLADGENYKLPDIKDIIRRYLRKYY